MKLLSEILAAEAGNVALRTLALGGVYLAGGLPRRLVGFLERPDVRARFGNKGRLSGLLERYALSRPRVVPEPGVDA